MLEYWMANNSSWPNSSRYQIDEVLQDPALVTLFLDYPPWLLYFAAGCCILFMLIGIPGNLITVAALFRTKKLRNATAVFIMNLSISDLMFCCFNLPLATSTFWHSAWLHGQLLCRLFPLLRYSLLAVSIFTVLAITINRYIMIGHPRLYRKLYKPKYLALMVVAIWLSGFGALVATWFEQWGRFGLDPVIGSCSILPDVHGRSPKEFLFILAFVTPCLAIVVCYARIFYIVRKTALRSRRTKVSRDLTKSNLEVRYTKSQHFEDSAIGSSCVATLTTIENGNSPTRQQDKLSFVGTNSPKLSSSFQNFRQSPKFDFSARCSTKVVDSRRYGRSSDDVNHDGGTKFRGALRNSAVNLASMTNDRVESMKDQSMTLRSAANEQSASSPNIHRDEDDASLETSAKSSIPTTESLRRNDLNPSRGSQKVVFSLSVNSLVEPDGVRSRPLPSATTSSMEAHVDEIPFIDGNLPVQNFDAESGTNRNANEKSESNDNYSETRPQIRFEEVNVQVPCDRQFSEADEPISGFDSAKLPLRFEENSLQVPRRFPFVQNSSDNLLNSQMSRYDEVSEDYASSRSDSPSEKRSGKKSQTFRRESRFRSIRNRHSETGKLTNKDKKLLKMILVIFVSFLICYLPITITKTFKEIVDWRGLNIAGYILIYLTTCINPVIYVVMSSEYRSAYKNVLLCRSDSVSTKPNGGNQEKKKPPSK